VSLLARVQGESPDPAAWRRFVDLYEPLILGWCRASGLQSADAEDVCQEVFKAVCGKIGQFEHGRGGGTLRGWLRRITANALASWGRRQNAHPAGAGGSDALAAMLTVPNPTAANVDDCALTREEKRALLRRAVMGSLAGLAEQTREIFCRLVVDRESPAHVAAAMKVRVDVVYTAKSRVLKRLKEEYGDLIDLGDL
jgi:RNA polymerase sigma-70 factor (ECF subfamily)